MKPVILLAEAVEDLEHARDFYDHQQQGVGDYCVRSLIADMEKLGDYHRIHPKHFGCYRMLASRFPFGLYLSNHRVNDLRCCRSRLTPGPILDSFRNGEAFVNLSSQSIAAAPNRFD